MKDTTTPRNKAGNPDPVTGAPGFHPIGNTVGGFPGAVAGAVVGAAGGPVGVVIGAAIGGILGGAAGDAIAEMMNPSDVDAYWKNEFKARPFGRGRSYEEVKGPLYFGTQERLRLGRDGEEWEDIEADLSGKWEESEYQNNQGWNDVREATRAAYNKTSDEIASATRTVSTKREK